MAKGAFELIAEGTVHTMADVLAAVDNLTKRPVPSFEDDQRPVAVLYEAREGAPAPFTQPGWYVWDKAHPSAGAVGPYAHPEGAIHEARLRGYRMEVWSG